MARFPILDNLPVKQKLLLITMAVSLLGLLLAAIAFAGYDRYRIRQNMAQDIAALGRLVADRSAAALVFDDPNLAGKNLAALQVKSSIVEACIYREDQAVFASYAAGDGGRAVCPAPGRPGHVFGKDSLLLFEPVLLEGKQLGTVYVRASLRELDELWRRYLGAALVIVGLASLAAFFLSSRLQGIISEPLLHLTHTAERIARQKDYSLRAVKEGDDELGVLVAAFNDMLETIARQNQELIDINRDLEGMVAARTSELTAANTKLKELDALKSMFIASMSHELRTPLNSIIGFTGMTLQGLSGPLNEEQSDNLSRVFQAARHLLALITDVIDISKIEAGRIDTFPETVALGVVCAEATSTIEPQLREKALSLTVAVAEDLVLHTDRKRLLQCLLNLLSNAVKFTERGGVTLRAVEQGDWVRVEVSDTGIGIGDEDLPRLFEAFERLDTHLRIKAGGTGLGLYLTKKIATDLLRGRVTVQSRLGQGSTFAIDLPKCLPTVTVA